MAVTANVILRQVRVDHLTMFKVAAAGQAARTGVFAALLARTGMEGPHLPFEGRAGWCTYVAGENLSFRAFGGKDEPFKILATRLKIRPCAGNTISSVLAAEKIALQVPVEHIEMVCVEVYKAAKTASGTLVPHPQPLANETILPHFHGNTQFQIFPAGSGVMGKTPVQPLMLQYKDHHTAYGPLVAGAHGLTFIALRNRTGDSAPVYLGKPGYKEKLKPSRRRNWISSPITLSTRPVLQYRREASWDPVFEPEKIDDEMSAHLLRLGGAMSTSGPDPKAGDGYYVFVANGSLAMNGDTLPAWSMVFVEPTEEAFEIKAGRSGLEALVMQFPKDEH